MNIITVCLVLLVAGLICLVVEMFIPGFGVIGFCGLLALVASGVLAVLYIPHGWLFVTAEAALLAGIGYLVYQGIRKKQLLGKLIMTDTLVEDVPEISGLDTLIGKEGRTTTVLRPFGEADFNGRQLDVCSDGAYIDRGARVKVFEVKNNRIMVREVIT